MVHSVLYPFDWSGPFWQAAVCAGLLAILQMSFVGLWSIWAGLGRRHWFVRVAVVLGWVSLPLVIPAYEVLIALLDQRWSPSSCFPCGGRGVPPELVRQSARSRRRRRAAVSWQYSILDLMLLAVFVAWLSAMLTRVPASVWVEWRSVVQEGVIAAFLTLAAAGSRSARALVAAAAAFVHRVSVRADGGVAHAGEACSVNPCRSAADRIWTVWLWRAVLAC